MASSYRGVRHSNLFYELNKLQSSSYLFWKHSGTSNNIVVWPGYDRTVLVEFKVLEILLDKVIKVIEK